MAGRTCGGAAVLVRLMAFSMLAIYRRRRAFRSSDTSGTISVRTVTRYASHIAYMLTEWYFVGEVSGADTLTFTGKALGVLLFFSRSGN